MRRTHAGASIALEMFSAQLAQLMEAGVKLTHHILLSMAQVIQLDDLVLLPREEALPYESSRAMQIAGQVPVETEQSFNTFVEVIALYERYARERYEARGTEPAWMRDVPMSAQKMLRTRYATEHEDVLAIMYALPYSGISYVVHEGGLCEDFCQRFKLFRLQSIKQLGFLQAPWSRETSAIRMSLSEGSRYSHSLDVMTVATTMGHNVGLSKTRLNTLRLAALSHDMGTPAGGDSVKLVDPHGLDEDENYPALIDAIEWEDLRKKYRIDRTLLVDTVRNEGVLGQLLDIADKIAYIGRDLHDTKHHIERATARYDQLGMRTLKSLLEYHPYVCSLWDSVVVRNGQVAFTDAARLYAFLSVRVVMFRELYYHPYSRFGEFLLSRLLVKVLYQRGDLTKEDLLRMTDGELERKLGEAFGLPNIMHTCSTEHARVKTFRSIEEASAFTERLALAGNAFFLLDDNRRAIKPGTDLLVTTKNGVAPFEEAYPADAKGVHEMASRLPLIHVYYLAADPELPRDVLARLKEELRG